MRQVDSLIRKLYLIDKKKMEDISTELNISLEYIQKLLKNITPPKRSKGEVSLLNILRKIYPAHKIEEQVPIGSLSMDFYIRKLRLCIELDGQQHHQKIEHFHGTGTTGDYKFEHQLDNDNLKDKLARENNICLIRIRYDVKLTEENIRRILGEYSTKISENLAEYNSGIGL